MSSAWSASTSSAATEHGTGPLLQSTAGANIIFINIDWKRSRHANDTHGRILEKVYNVQGITAKDKESEEELHNTKDEAVSVQAANQ